MPPRRPKRPSRSLPREPRGSEFIDLLGSTRVLASPPFGLPDAPKRPKRPPRSRKDSPRSLQEATRTTPESPTRLYRPPRRSSGTPRRLQYTTSSGDLSGHFEHSASRSPREASRGPKKTPRGPKTAPKRLQTCLPDAPQKPNTVPRHTYEKPLTHTADMPRVVQNLRLSRFQFPTAPRRPKSLQQQPMSTNPGTVAGWAEGH